MSSANVDIKNLEKKYLVQKGTQLNQFRFEQRCLREISYHICQSFSNGLPF